MPLSHACIESLSVNLGECELQNLKKVYHIWAKLHYLLQVPDAARKSYRSFFEGFYNDAIKEKVS